jgi:hypothetical protein
VRAQLGNISSVRKERIEKLARGTDDNATEVVSVALRAALDL